MRPGTAQGHGRRQDDALTLQGHGFRIGTSPRQTRVLVEGIAVGAGEMGGNMEGVVRRVHVHGARHPLRRWQVLIVETKRPEGRNGATAVVEMAPVPVHGHQKKSVVNPMWAAP
jgi:hypothetical protein